MSLPIAYITRKECFSACHRLHRYNSLCLIEEKQISYKIRYTGIVCVCMSDVQQLCKLYPNFFWFLLSFAFFDCSNELSDGENELVYGKCNHVNGHGHNYIGNGIYSVCWHNQQVIVVGAMMIFPLNHIHSK